MPMLHKARLGRRPLVILAACYVIIAWSYVNATELCSKSWGNVTQPDDLNVVDVQCMLLTLMVANPPNCLSGDPDINCSGTADVLDLQLLLLKVLGAPPGSNCDTDADGCADKCVKDGIGGCKEFCRIWGAANATVYCPLRVAAGSCCSKDTEAVNMLVKLEYPQLQVTPVGLYDHGCSQSPVNCSPKSLWQTSATQYFWPAFTGSLATFAPTHDIILNPAFSKAKGDFALSIVALPKLYYVPFSTAQYDTGGTINGQEEVLGIGFKLLVPIVETEPVKVCFVEGVVDSPWMIPIAFPWVNLDHVFVWSTYSCGCSACD